MDEIGPLIMRCQSIYRGRAAGAVDIKEKGFGSEKDVALLRSSMYGIPTVLGTVLGTGDIRGEDRQDSYHKESRKQRCSLGRGKGSSVIKGHLLLVRYH